MRLNKTIIATALTVGMLFTGAAHAQSGPEWDALNAALAAERASPTKGNAEAVDAALAAYNATLPPQTPAAVLAPPPTTVEVEPNGTSATATALPLTGDYVLASGTIGAAGDQDFWSIALNAGDRVWAYLDPGSPPAAVGTGRDSQLRLFDTNGTTEIEFDDDDGAGAGGDGTQESGLASVIAGRGVAAAGTYFLRTNAFGAAETINPMPMFVARTTAAMQSPEVEANNTSATANAMPAGVSVRTASIGVAGDVDFYQVTAAVGDVIYYAADGNPERDGTNTNVTLQVIAADGTTVLQTTNSASGTPSGEGNRWVVTTAGNHFIRVVADSAAATGTYDLMVASTPSAVPPSISLEATVGTTPLVCAGTDAVTVSAGTEVHYCYTVTNTGGVTLNSHDLSDTVLGTILNDFAFALVPGASAFIVLPSTPTATVTNTGTWTASTGTSYGVNPAAAFSYIPINATGTALNLTDDGEANIVSPFPITYFGTTSTNLRVGNNGGILFGVTTGDLGFTNAALPNAALGPAILPFWDDLNGTTGNVYWQVQGAAPNRQLIVEWFQRSHFSVAGNTATFQVVISEGSNQIRYQYLDVDFGSAGINNGASATVGINASGTVAQQVSFNTASLANNQAILFTPPQSATAVDSTTVTVLIPNMDVTPASLTATAPVNQSTSAPLTIANTGQGDLNWVLAEEPVAQPQTTPAGRGTEADAREEASATPMNKPGAAPEAMVPHSGPIWSAPEAVLYDNGPLVTNPGAGAGGADVSALQTAAGNNILGFGHAVTTGFRMADDFVVGGSGWLINTVTFFAYQTGSSTTSTINAVNVRIWDGPPGAPGSAVVFGDTTTNRLVSSTYSGINRATDTNLIDATRPIMANVVAINTFLPAGTYWFDWQTGGTLGSGPWAPPVSLLGQTAPAGANALQFSGSTLAWAPAVDTGTSAAVQDLPFVVDGLADCTSLADVPWLSLSATNGTNAAGTSTPVTVSFDATGLAVGSYSARLCATSNDPDLGPGNGTGLVVVPVTFDVTASADLVMALTSAPDPVTAGTNLTYTATVTNSGPSAADNVSFTLPLPAGTSFVSATPSAGGSCNAASPVVCTWAGSTAAAASHSASIVALVASGQTAGLSATATATSATFDPALANNEATVATAVQVQSDLSITLTDAPDPVTAGTQLTYSAVVTNIGPSDATGVSTSMAIPANTSFVSGSVSGGGSCAGTPVVCTITGSILPASSRTVTIVVLVAASVPEGSIINASIAVSSASPDPVAGNNTASTTTTVNTRADLLVSLTASVAQTLVNVPVTFTATSLNQGPSDAQNVSVTINLTPDFRYSSHSATGATCTNPQVGNTGSIVCTWNGATAPGVTRTLTVVAFSNVEGPTGVNASTASNTTDPNPNNNASSVTVQVGYLFEEIPTLGNLGLLLMGLMIGLIGFVAVRRQA